jgi:hypothetical protein
VAGRDEERDTGVGVARGRDDDVPEGGDAACWANRVCAECGRLNDAERPEVCESCGARFG